MTDLRLVAQALAVLLLTLPPLHAQTVAHHGALTPTESGGLPIAGLEDYRVPVGRLEGGVLRVTLEARLVAWHPWGEAAREVPAHAFAADGAPPRIPGPLIRVTAGTQVHVTLHNPLAQTLVVRGLRDRGHPPSPGPAFVWAPFLGDSVVIAAGGSAEVRFTPTTPGSYFYYGRVLRPGDQVVPPPLFSGDREDGPFVGVLIVDPVGASPPPEERIFLMTQWMDRGIRESWDPAIRLMINGRSWPATERLSYTQGDSVRWRVLNASGIEHPMHLHGFFFRVDARGDQRRETELEPGERRLAVTETVAPGETMRLTWVPDEPGNWIFHCHLMRHMSGMQAAPAGAESASHHADARGSDLMAGLVLGITVQPDGEARPSSDSPRRRLTLHINRQPGVFGVEPAYGFVLQQGETPPASDSVRFPGSPIVLTRGEPAEIVVRNRADVPLGVHWHGLELESWADGVPGWSGYPGSIRPAVAPGDSFVVRMTPPRAGSFMYHVHSEPGHQLSQGLYGAFLVLEPGERWNPETDRLLVLGSLGAEDNAPPAVNGAVDPAPIELRAGTTYRLRVMHISPDDQKHVQLLAGEETLRWRMVAKDGADLPADQAQILPADLHIRVGETYDFLWTPEGPGERTLRITTRFDNGPPAFLRDGPPPHTMAIPVIVR